MISILNTLEKGSISRAGCGLGVCEKVIEGIADRGLIAEFELIHLITVSYHR
jgi:hypothetical protein